MDLIERQSAINAILDDKIVGKALIVMKALGDGRLALTLNDACDRHIRAIEQLPSAQPEPEIKPIEYRDCANAMLMMWMDNVVTDGEYSRIMDKINAHEIERRNNE